MTDIVLKWHGPPVVDLEPQIVKELRELLKDGLNSASSLAFHNVMIGSHDGPVIFVWGEENDPVFHCKFEKEMSDEYVFVIEEFKDAPWYKTIKKHLGEEE